MAAQGLSTMYHENYPHVKCLANIFVKFSPSENNHVYSYYVRLQTCLAVKFIVIVGNTHSLKTLKNIFSSFQLITVYKVPNLDPDWLMAERGIQKGKVPTTYLEVLE